MVSESPRWDAVFIDRDGTLTRPPQGRYVEDPRELELSPGAADAVRRLNGADVPVFVVTNQQGVAYGTPTPQVLEDIHRRLVDLLDRHGAHLDAVYVCPHRAGTCDCRKPQDGLIRRALSEHPAIDPRRCAIVGDNITDTAAGTRLGLFRVLLGAGVPASDSEVDRVVGDLAAAIDLLLD